MRVVLPRGIEADVEVDVWVEVETVGIGRQVGQTGADERRFSSLSFADLLKRDMTNKMQRRPTHPQAT